MPHISKGGKFIFGWSVINSNGCVKIPEMTYDEYKLSTDNNVILISGSKKSGGFCVSNYTMLKDSIMSGLFSEYPEIKEYSSKEGECKKYKGRLYCWLKIGPDGIITLPSHTMKSFCIKPDDRLLSIRGSDIAFVMAVKGPIIDVANEYQGTIDIFKC